MRVKGYAYCDDARSFSAGRTICSQDPMPVRRARRRGLHAHRDRQAQRARSEAYLHEVLGRIADHPINRIAVRNGEQEFCMRSAIVFLLLIAGCAVDRT
jgi:hypothetical protein